jgi:hypothetical protein
MGTPHLTIFVERGVQVCVLYGQFDGHFFSHGQKLKEFLNPFYLVNGYGSEDANNSAANGIGCLAAQSVAHFKTRIGNFLLQSPGAEPDQEPYVYVVSTGSPIDGWKSAINIAAYCDGKLAYTGPVSEFFPRNLGE